MSNNNIYNYKTPKSGNEESGFFNIKGRISRKAFFLRWFLSIVVYALFTFFYSKDFFCEIYDRSFIFFETVYLYILPPFVFIFNWIQGAKRMHDVNKSGWYFLFPIYNLYLIFMPGTKGNNAFGIDPTPLKNIQYFDEIQESEEKGINQKEVSNSDNRSGLDKWREHLSLVRQEHPNKTYQEALEIARNTYESSRAAPRKPIKTPKKKSKKYLLFVFISIAAAYYYFGVYEPMHRDSDEDGIADKNDYCPFEYGESNIPVMGCPDYDIDGVADSMDDCPDEQGNEIDGCYYYKKVTFYNNSSQNSWLSIAYKDGFEWVCKGWYFISANTSIDIDLPRYFEEDEVFWYGVCENGSEWTGSYRYFYVARGASSFEVRDGEFIERDGGSAIKKGFYKLALTDENTSMNFGD